MIETVKPTRATGAMGSIATRVIWEDDEVRIWDQVLGPHEVLQPHRHGNDYYLVDVKGDGAALKVEYLPGNQAENQQDHPYEVKRGNHHFVRKGGVEKATNLSDKRVRLILVELLQDSG